ncbi:hypothetical protein HRbin40_02315 [bacterium HR40]|nr:hypothetical protein HRbin40_02315 [bacterium HR40]
MDGPDTLHTFSAPFDRHEPAQVSLPLLISAPHSGMLLPPEAAAGLALSPEELRELDDGPVHRLFAAAVADGATMLVARLRRVFVDLNRDPLEIDPALVPDLAPSLRPRLSLRVRAGLGVVPSRLGTRPLWRRPLGSAEVARRLHTVYYPYHRELARILDSLRARFGVAVLLDVHSMPTSAAADLGPVVDVAIGDRFGQSAAPTLVEAALARLRDSGLVCERNRPFAGGHITETYGRPAAGIHALQIEIRRGLFLDERSHEPHAGGERLAAVMHAVSRAVAEAALRLRPATAAPEVALSSPADGRRIAAD